MRMEDTICHDVTESIRMLEYALETGKLDPAYMSKTMHSIRKKATKMEAGLKLRKEMMVEAGLEDEYQIRKGKKNIKPGVNKIAQDEVKKVEMATEFEVRVKQDGQVLYENKIKAGVLCFVEEITDIDDYGQIDGQTQKLAFGQPLATWYAFDQLRQSMEDKAMEVMQAMKTAIMNRKYADPKVKKQMLTAMQQMNIK